MNGCAIRSEQRGCMFRGGEFTARLAKPHFPVPCRSFEQVTRT